VPEPLGLGLARMLGFLLRDVLITRDELVGLQRDLLVSRESPACATRFGGWMREHGDALGRRYQSELARHFEDVSQLGSPRSRR